MFSAAGLVPRGGGRQLNRLPLQPGDHAPPLGEVRAAEDGCQIEAGQGAGRGIRLDLQDAAGQGLTVRRPADGQPVGQGGVERPRKLDVEGVIATTDAGAPQIPAELIGDGDGDDLALVEHLDHDRLVRMVGQPGPAGNDPVIGPFDPGDERSALGTLHDIRRVNSGAERDAGMGARDDGSRLHDGRAGGPGFGARQLGQFRRCGIHKQCPVAAVDKAFGGHVLGQQHGMHRQLDAVGRDRVHVFTAGDGAAIHERLGGNQNPVDEEIVEG